jgi:hypothetical protein
VGGGRSLFEPLATAPRCAVAMHAVAGSIGVGRLNNPRVKKPHVSMRI